MFTGIVLGVLSAAALVQQTDTIVDVGGANRLELESLRGEVVIRTWDRDAVRVQASHSASRTVEVRRSGRTLSVDVEVDRGIDLAGEVDFQLTVPRALDLDLEGMALEVDIQGSEGQVRVTTVHGSIRVQGGRGTIVLGTVEGEIEVEGAEGRLEVNGVAGAVTIRDCSGDIYAQSVAGSITMEGIASRDVEAGTVSGELRYSGNIDDGGVYNFGSHGGSLWLYLPSGMNARVEAVTLAGDIEVDYPGAQIEPTRGRGFPGLNEKEINFETGTASARVDVETFGGTIHILRQGG
jgi:DUF4097 and DUF4098 domain-containing protein YvlB